MNHNQIIFLGELGADDLLRSFLRNALIGTRFDFDTVTIHDTHSPVFASAIGTAIIQKALVDAPDPKNCIESRECEELRERVYKEALRSPPVGEL